MDSSAFKIKDCPRITRVDHFIRRTCIDELPRIVNILKCDMSIFDTILAKPRDVEPYIHNWKAYVYITQGLICC